MESQHGENEEFAEELGLTLARTYTDNDLSAFSGVERPEYERLLADIEAGQIGSVTIWHANRLHRSSDEVNVFIRLARAHQVKLYSTSKGEAYNLEKASGRKQLRDDTSEAEYESEHRGERVALARKRQARNGDYGGGVRPYGWGVDSGRVRSVCVNPKAPAMDRIYEDRPVLDMTRHNEAETAEIRRWADDQQMTTIRAGLSAATAQSPLADFTMTDDAQRTWDDLNIGRKREVLRTLLTVMLPPLGRGHTFNRDLIQIRPCAPAGPAAAD